MWIAYAFGSALFAGLTSILAKCGIKKTDSNVATALRTIVVLVFSWLMVLVTGADHNFAAVSGKTWCFLLSGIATGASWLCYFKALQLGEVNKVVPIDKSSTILTILLALIFFQEGISLTCGHRGRDAADAGVNPTEKEVRTSVLTSFLAIIITERSILKRLPCARGGGAKRRRGCPASIGREIVRLLVRSANLSIPQSACADSSLYSREPIGWVRFSGTAAVLGLFFSPFRSSNRYTACRQAAQWT